MTTRERGIKGGNVVNLSIDPLSWFKKPDGSWDFVKIALIIGAGILLWQLLKKEGGNPDGAGTPAPKTGKTNIKVKK